MIPALAVVFVLGSIIGSFLNVCIYRVPRHQSIIWPSSRCPACSARIRFYDNIPIISYIVLNRQCRACGATISFRYPAVETLNGLLYALVFWRFGPGWPFVAYAVFCSAMILITFIDLDFQIIPDRITLPGIPLGLILGSLLLPDPFLRAEPLGWRASFIGAAAGFGFYYLVAYLSVAILRKEGMGGGDIKLMAMIGGCLGWKTVVLTTFLGSLSGALAGILMMVLQGRERGSLIPFGPFLAFGALVSLLYGQEILQWYLYRG